MEIETTTLEGETLDFVIFRVHGRVDEALLSKTFDMNPELAEYGTVLPAGVIVKLPAIDNSVTEVPTVKLWD